MVNSSYTLDAYKSHDLSIAMRTSSGDTINMDFSNKSALSLKYEQNQDSSSGTLSFASMQSFDFSMQSNGIDAQDKKEIDAFMKIAQPYIDSFLKELGEDAPQSPINKIANSASIIITTVIAATTELVVSLPRLSVLGLILKPK